MNPPRSFRLGERLMALYARAFARRALAPFHRLLFHTALRGLGVYNYQSFRLSGEQHLLQKVLRKRFAGRDPLVLLDVGANEGAFSTELLRLFPSATLHAFEPHPDTSARLRKCLPPTACVHALALGDQAGTLTLHDLHGEGSSLASLHADVLTHLHGQPARTVDVQVDTLDGFAARHGLDHIDLLKIDTEGNERAVLEGGTRLLAEGAVDVVLFEFNEMNTISRSFLRDFRALLPGYRLYRLLPNGLLPIGTEVVLSELFGFQNIVALPETERN